MPLRFRNLFQLAENIESLIQWLFQLGLVSELNGVSCKFCEKGRFGLRKLLLLLLLDTLVANPPLPYITQASYYSGCGPCWLNKVKTVSIDFESLHMILLIRNLPVYV